MISHGAGMQEGEMRRIELTGESMGIGEKIFRRKWNRRMILAAGAVLMFLVFCRRQEQPNGAGSVHVMSGSIRMAGSSSMEKLADALAEGFMEKYPDVTVTVQFTGSGAGIEAVAAGSADVGNSSRSLKAAEIDEGLKENLVAVDGIAVCVDSSNTVSGLTRSQLADIYTGSIVNWSAVGGRDAPIVVVGREAGSGTRSAFEKLLGIEEQCTYANELDSTGAVLARVSSTPGAVGYLSFDAVDPSVAVITLDGAEPNVANVKDGSYPLYRPFIMVTKGELARQNTLIKEWFRYVYSEEGQTLAAESGLVRVR